MSTESPTATEKSPLIGFLEVPRDEGGTVPLGVEFATGITQITSIEGGWLAPQTVAALEELAQQIRPLGRRYQHPQSQETSHPALGFQTDYPDFSCIIPYGRDFDGSAELRALILYVRTQPRADPDATHALLALRKAYLRARESSPNNFSALRSCWDAAHDNPRKLSRPLTALCDARTAEHVIGCLRRGRRAAPDTTTFKLGDPSPDAVRVERPWGFVEPTPPTKPPFSDWPDTPWIPSDDNVTLIDGVIPPVEGFTEHPYSSHREADVYAQLFSEEYSILHSGALLPNTDGVLTDEEAGGVLCHLAMKSRESRVDHDCEGVIAMLSLKVALVCGRSRHITSWAICKWLARESIDPATFCFGITPEFWTSAVPVTVEHPVGGHHPFAEVNRFINLPWTRDVAGDFQWIRANLHASREVVSSHKSVQSLLGRIAAARSELRKEVTPRFNERRMTATLGTAVMCTTGDMRHAQILAGDRLERSDGSLYYYSRPAAELVRSYVKTLERWDVEVCEFTQHDPEHLVGGPNSGIDSAHVRDAVAALEAKVEKTLAKGGSAENILAMFNHLALWTIVMFVATVGHRMTYHLQAITRGHFLYGPDLPGSKGGLVAFADKLHSSIFDDRVSGLPQIFIEQLKVYLSFAVRALGVLSRAKYRDKSLRARQVLSALLDGSGSLFVEIIEERGEWFAIPLTHDAVSAGWPELETSPGYLRHLFASQAEASSVPVWATSQQLGHITDWQPYTACDPDAPVDYLQDVCGPLETHLKRFGFHTLGSYRSPYLPPNVRTLTGAQILDDEAGITRAIADADRQRRQLRKIKPSVRKATSVLVQTFVDDRLNEMRQIQAGPRLSVSAEDICVWLDSLLKGQSFRDMMLRNQALRAVVRGLNRKKLIKSPVVPMLVTRPPDFPAVRPNHFLAYRAASHWTAKILADWNAASFGPELTDEQLAGAVFLMAFLGGLTQKTRLLDVLRNTEVAVTYPASLRKTLSPQPPSHVIVDMVLRGSVRPNEDYRETLAIDGPAADLLCALTRYRAELSRLDLEALERVMQSSQTIQELLSLQAGHDGSALDAILTIAALARRVIAGGIKSAWERGELNTVGLSLERDAALRFGIEQPPRTSGDGSSKGFPKSAESHSDEIYRELHKAFHTIDSGRDRSTVGTQIQKDLLPKTPPGSAIEVLCQWVARELIVSGGARLAVSTIKVYLSSIGGACLRRFRDLDLRELPSEYVQSTLEKFSLRGSHNALPAIQRMLPVLGDLVDVEWTLVGSGRQEVVRSRPPFITKQEGYSVIADFSTLNAKVGDERPGPSRFYHVASSLNSTILQAFGNRLSESAKRAVADFHGVGRAATMRIRQRMRTTLKRPNSARVFVLSEELDAATVEQFVLHAKNLREARRLQNDRSAAKTHSGRSAFAETDVFRHPDDGLDFPIDAEISGRIRGAISTVAPAAPTDTRGFRHLVGTSALATCLPARQGESLGLLPGLNDVHFPPGLECFSRRSRWRYQSMRLGHATPITTANSYAQIVPMIGGSGQHLPHLGVDALSKISGLSKDSVIGRRDRARSFLVVRSRAAKIGFRSYPYLPAPESKTDERPACPDMNPSLCLLADIAMRLRQQRSAREIAIDVALEPVQVDQIINRLRAADQCPGAGYLRIRRSGIKGKRRPQSTLAVQILARIDKALLVETLRSEDLVLWCDQAATAILGAGIRSDRVRISMREAFPKNACSIVGERLAATKLPSHERKLVILALRADSVRDTDRK